jgi:predicted metal-dependent hydrolase
VTQGSSRSQSRPQSHPQSKNETIRLDLHSDPPVRIVKSKRRKRHIAAYRQSGEIVISVPFRTTRAEITALIPEMVARVIAGEERSRKSERELEARAALLLDRYLPEFTLRAASITWRPMNERWGSCTTVDRTIRISQRLQSSPDYVIDYVLFHELIHLEIPGHGAEFHTLLSRFPELMRAEAFLEGYEAGERGC